ncbi:hypothetical protein DYB38_004426 [Aphanomyces astaci]|uniref:Saposin B-type domain-containing protein n=1 Tax=Aphanomyces astaci TaxID=112090 RepID=A0A397DRV5_APHAT|nr:hypothetical protein DYB38_004426 [Aphanomyces astaci]
MKLYVQGMAVVAAVASLVSPVDALSEDWIGDVMKQTFPDMQSVMSVVLTKPDPCEVAVTSLTKPRKDEDMFDKIFERLFPAHRACRGQLMFSQVEEEECMAIQSSPSIEDMLAHGITSPPLVCGWRQFWVEAADDTAPFNSCELCERSVAMIENTFDKQELALEVVEEALKLLCEYLPSSSKCNVILTRLNDIVKWLKEGLSPKHICQKISMCKETLPRPTAAATSSTASSYLRASPERDELCAICRDNTNAMHSLIGMPHGLKLYKDGLDAVCAHAAESKACQFMTSHFASLAKQLKQGDDVLTTCQKVRACVSETAIAAAAPTFLGCVYCEFVGQVVTSALHQGGADTLPVVKEGLDGLCSNLPPQAQCSAMDQHFDELADLMGQGKTPKDGCEAVRMCAPVEKGALVVGRPPSAEAKPAHFLAILDQLVEQLGSPTYDVAHYVGCSTCEHVAYAIQRVEKSHKASLPKLKKAISTLCRFLPPCTKCRDIVAKFDELDALLNKGDQAKPACIELGFCIPEVEPAESSSSSSHLVDEALKQLEARVNDKTMMVAKTQSGHADILGCVMCQSTGEVIAQVAKYSKDAMPLLKIGMETLCTRLPAEAKCAKVLGAFDQLAQLIEVGSSPLDACVHVQLCDKVAASSETVVEQALHKMESTVSTWTKGDDVTCEMCEAVTATIMSIEKVNKQYLMAFKLGLGVLCDRFQTPQLVESGKDFVEACHVAKLCDATKTGPGPLGHLKDVNGLESQVQSWLTHTPSHESSDVLSCVFCEYTGLVIAKVVAYDKSVVPFVKQGIDTLCSRLPMEAQCEAVVAQFDPLAKLIEDGVAAPDACAKVHLCGPPTKQIATTSNGFVQSQLGDFAVKLHAREEATTRRPNDILTCLLCEDVSQLIKVVTNYDKDVVPLLKTGLQALCSQVQQLQAQCNTVVGKFDALAALVEGGTDPSEACFKTHLCALGKLATLDLEAQVASLVNHVADVGSDEGCLFCQYASESIGTVIKMDKHQLPLVREAIGAMCSILPPSVHCDDVNEHFEDLAKWLEGGSTALDVCHRIAVCKVATHQQQPAVLQMQQVIDDLVADE